MTDTANDVVIVGGGAIGAACACELAATGRRVRLVDAPAPAGRAWEASAGMLAPQIEAREDDPLFEFGLAGRERYAAIAGPLHDATGIDIGLWQPGIARMAVDEADVAALRGRVAWQRQQGHLCDWLDVTEVRDRWPWLGANLGALWAPREGAVDPTRLVTALRRRAEQLGAELTTDTVHDLEVRAGRVLAARGHARHVGEHVVLAAGAWSGTIDGTARPLAVAPIRGQMLALPWPDGIPPAIVYRRDGYLLHRAGEAVVGSTMEAAGFRAEVTAAGIADLLAIGGAICPVLAGRAPVRSWAGLRPITPDGLPIIGPEPRVAGLWYATGHGRHGILLAAITGQIIAQLIAGDEPAHDMSLVHPGRFWSW